MQYDIFPDRLTRVRDGYLAGVAGGVARRFDLEPAFVRIVWLASILFWGLGVGLYLLLWWLMPREGQVPLEPAHHGRLSRSSVDRKVGGVFGGIAYHYDYDPTLVRLVGAMLIPVSLGLFIFAYLAACVIIPRQLREPAFASSLPRE